MLPHNNLRDQEAYLKRKFSEYHAFFHKHRRFPKFYPIASIAAWIIHLLMLIVCMANAYALTGWKAFEGLLKIPVIREIPSVFPFYSLNFWTFALCSVLTVYVLPSLMRTGLIFFVFNCVSKHPAPVPPMKDSMLNAYKELWSMAAYTPSWELNSVHLYVEVGIAIILGISVSWGAAILLGLNAAGTALIWYFLASSSFCYGKTHSEFREFEKDMQYYLEGKKRHEEQEKRERLREAEEEKRRKQLEIEAAERKRQWEAEGAERKRQQELKEQRAREAEVEFTLLEDPDSDEAKVRQLADLGSESACLHYGRKLYYQYVTEALTSSEKTKLAEDIISYVGVSADTGNVEGKFLLLGMRAMRGSSYRGGWKGMLKEARKIKASGKLPEQYRDTLDTIISGAIDMVDKCEAEERKRAAEERKRATEEARAPVIKRRYCRHYAAGKCTYYSSSYLTNCNYPNDPGQCPTALMEKLLMYEFE